MTHATQADFARSHGVTRAAITQWKIRGYVSMVGKWVDVEASDRALQGARRGRFDPDRKALSDGVNGLSGEPRFTPTRKAGAETVNVEWTNELGHRHARQYPDVCTLSVHVGTSSEMVLAIREHLPMAITRSLVERIVAKARAEAVEAVDADFGPPPGFASWGDHPWFTRPPLTEAEWQELEEEAGR